MALSMRDKTPWIQLAAFLLTAIIVIASGAAKIAALEARAQAEHEARIRAEDSILQSIIKIQQSQDIMVRELTRVATVLDQIEKRSRNSK